MHFTLRDLSIAPLAQTPVQYRESLDQRVVGSEGVVEGQFMHKGPARFIDVLPAHLAIFNELGFVTLLLLACHAGIVVPVPIAKAIEMRSGAEIGDNVPVQRDPRVAARAGSIGRTVKGDAFTNAGGEVLFDQLLEL